MAKKNAPKLAAPAAIRDTWNLALMYSSPSDPRLERDLRAIERGCAEFEKRWRPQAKKLGQLPTLARALNDYEALSERLSGRPMYYLGLSRAVATDDKTILAAIGRASDRLTKAGNRTTFFALEIGRLPRAVQERALADKKLARYRHLLDNYFRAGAHQLSEAEENLSSLLARPGAGMWEEYTDGRVSALTVEWQGKTIPAQEALSKVTTIDSAEERRELRALAMRAIRTEAPAAEAEMNALYTWKKVQDELRGYARPEDGVIQGYEIDTKTVDTLRREVERAYPLAHRFFAAKAKLMGMKKLAMSDTYAKLPNASGAPEWKPTFPEAVAALRKLVAPIGDGRYARLLDEMVANGQIDAHPRKGKTGGAFCASQRDLPTYILLNHDPSPNWFTVLAHEFGHASHAWMHRKQPIFYDGVTMMTAEVASTFFESLAHAALAERAPDEATRLRYLVDRAGDFAGSVFAQVSAHAYEETLHRRIRAEGYLSAAEMAKECNVATERFLGPAVEVDEDSGYKFVFWGHLRSHFYFTPYSFGELVALALAEEYRRTGDARAFERFMEKGCSDRAEKIFADSGIDVTKPAFWRKGLAAFERMVEEIEAAAAKKR
jgi:oligoendopeptidase F